MPYPNEHSARLRDPDDFDPKSFSRTAGGKIYGKITVPKTVGIIWGKLKGNSKSSDPPTPQALRFSKESWTVEKAKKWLKDNGIKYISFEPASGGEKQSLDEPYAPIKACLFNEELSFAEAEQKPGFSIIGYSGKIIKDHWYWGDVAFDLEGLKFAKGKIPVLEEHFTSRRIGFTTKQEIADKVTVEGQFLENDAALAMARDLKAGFPMEASLYVPPSVVEKVEKGASVKVNGQTLTGPGAVFRQAVIKEVSMCVFGADSNTQSMAYADNDITQVKFNLIKEKTIMADEKLTIDTFNEQYPDIYSEVFNKGKAEGIAEAQRLASEHFAGLKGICGDDTELLIQCVEKQTSIEDARNEMMVRLKKDNKDLTEKLSKAKEQKVDPAVTEFRDGAPAPGAGDKFDEKTATDQQLKDHYAQDQGLQDEFHSEAAYLAYVKREVRKGGRS